MSANKKICELTDKTVLGSEGCSSARPRYASRAIVQRADGKFALMYLSRVGMHSLPGGGIEAGESPEDALRREILEETGCRCGQVTPLGYVDENRACQDFTQRSYYFYVTAVGDSQPVCLTDEERALGTVCLWLSFEELSDRIRNSRYGTVQRYFIQARDIAALDEYCAAVLSRA